MKKQNLITAAALAWHINTLQEVREMMNVSSYSQVMRWALDILAENPHTLDDAVGPYVYRLPSMSVDDRHVEVINRISREAGISKSQVMRNAIKALSNWKDEKGKGF